LRWISVEPDAHGFLAVGERATGVIAIGQSAVGVIAIGQLAFGFVAVGQLARGVFVLGQLAIGVFTVGQVAIGVHTCVAQLGIAGRKGKGGVFRIFPDPTPDEKIDTPEFTRLEHLHDEATGFETWIAASISEDGSIYSPDGHRAPIHASPPRLTRLEQIAKSPWRELWLHVRVEQLFEDASSTYRETSDTQLSLDLLQIRQPPMPAHLHDGYVTRLVLRSLGLFVILSIWSLTILHGLAHNVSHTLISKQSFLKFLVDF